VPLTGHGGSSPPSDTTFTLVNLHMPAALGAICYRIATDPKQRRDLLGRILMQPRDRVAVRVRGDADIRVP
jgi:hypothetical protein